MRRTVWDGAQERGELQMPGADSVTTAMENDTLPLARRGAASDTAFDANRFFGRVAYAYGRDLGEPLSVTRLGYVDAPGADSVVRFPAFGVVPLWNHRGQAENGAFDDGARVRCRYGSDGAYRCVRVQFPDGWFPYNKPLAVPLSWQGTLLEEKRDKAGTTQVGDDCVLRPVVVVHRHHAVAGRRIPTRNRADVFMTEAALGLAWGDGYAVAKSRYHLLRM